MRCAIKRLARAAIIAPAIIACSSTLQATGQPLFATLGDVGFNLVAVFSEVEGVRRKITKAVIAQRARRALQIDAAPRRLGGRPESGGDEVPKHTVDRASLCAQVIGWTPRGCWKA